ncbi:MAG: CocE/NonD family hydrolase [Candidatus Binatus sp.]|uniref:CocE/NonD family hydrolase n=1 Tax=Candidatus Binatus sp. TaxID=2811406 RepID=UPI00271A2B31|nr:CocE/NonD family hydrolase [Candidatus Binatus sp.]MDO8433010.1 CocE/NonD family hydrolase [Candidatus Binatus sp.]
MARIIVEKNIEVPMRDGCVLRADLFRPDTPEKLPVLLNRTPYNKAMPMVFTGTLDAIRAAEAGYNVMVQDCRGRFTSDGVWDCFTVEPRDGYDTIEWAARQAWANGSVGTYGASYMGATQWLAAKESPPSLKAMVPSITASDYHDGWTYQGGAFSLFFNVSWTMAGLAPPQLLRARGDNPLVIGELGAVMSSIDVMREKMKFAPLKEFPMFRAGAPYFFDWLAHPAYDQYWKALSIEESHAKINVPALNIGGWYDIFQGGTLRNFSGMRSHGPAGAARTGNRLIVGPWSHAVPFSNLVGAVDFGIRSSPISVDIDGAQLRFFDQYLKGKPAGDDAPVRLFVMGINEWRDETEWPIARTEWRRYYLHSRGSANSLYGDGALSTDAPGHDPADTFLYNPIDPVPTVGGGLCCYAGALQGGAFDQQAVEHRADVLVYSTEPLATDVEVTGPIELTLYASSSSPDTDFTAKLVDVSPCGAAINLTDGIIRARWRQSRSTPAMLTPGRVEEFKIDLWSTSNVFKQGHRIRLEVSSSNFPRFDRNPNTGHDLFADAEMRPAMQTVMHDASFASYLTLPVIPARR